MAAIPEGSWITCDWSTRCGRGSCKSYQESTEEFMFVFSQPVTSAIPCHTPKLGRGSSFARMSKARRPVAIRTGPSRVFGGMCFEDGAGSSGPRRRTKQLRVLKSEKMRLLHRLWGGLRLSHCEYLAQLYVALEPRLVDRSPRMPDILCIDTLICWATFIRPKPLSISTQEMDVIPSQAVATLLQAAQDGTLQKLLSDQDQARWRRQKEQEDVVNFDRFGGFPSFPSIPQENDMLRQEAAKSLLQAAEDGSLEAVLNKLDKERIWEGKGMKGWKDADDIPCFPRFLSFCFLMFFWSVYEKFNCWINYVAHAPFVCWLHTVVRL